MYVNTFMQLLCNGNGMTLYPKIAKILLYFICIIFAVLFFILKNATLHQFTITKVHIMVILMSFFAQVAFEFKSAFCIHSYMQQKGKKKEYAYLPLLSLHSLEMYDLTPHWHRSLSR